MKPTLITDLTRSATKDNAAARNAILGDLDYHLIRASLVIIFLFFGYQKWFQYEAQALLPYISNGPLLFWMYPVFGIRGATYFLGVAEWLFGGLFFWASGIKNWEFSERSVHVFPLSPPSRLSPSCRMAGLYLRVGSLP